MENGANNSLNNAVSVDENRVIQSSGNFKEMEAMTCCS